MTRSHRFVLLSLVLATITLVATSADARVVRIVVERTRPVLDGKSFGSAGPYERLDGTVYFEVDPRDPLNAVIVNLDRVPTTPSGKVGFSAPFYILKPVDMAKGNRKLFYGVNNRGNKLEYTWRTFMPPGANGNDPTTDADYGDAFLLRQGYAYIDAGWMGNLAPGNARLIPDLPIATQPDGRPIVANVRVEFADATGFSRPLEGNADHVGRIPHEPVDRDAARSTLSVRDTPGGAKTPIPSNRWAFGRCQNGEATLIPTVTDLCLFDGFKPERIYELTYRAKNPRVLGLGYAVTRDLASFLRYQTRDDAGNPNPLAESAASVGIRRAYGAGISSTGMYMRDWLYLGFNEDESHRKVFDAVQITIPGTHRLLANVEFADPNNYSRQDLWHDSISYSYPPLTFGVTTDPVSGKRDGILKRPATDPLVFQADSANEFWQMNASLNVADGAGKPVEIPKNVRLYFASSFQHGGGAGLLNPPGPVGMCQQPTQGNSWAPTLRALLVALDDWADKGVEPPPSNYPRLEDKTLVTLEEARTAFPKIPGVNFPTVINELALPDFGPEFKPTGGRIVKSPTLGRGYQVFVPKPDADGLDIAGIRPMEVAAPLATITGWALRAAGRREGSLCGLSGSFVPFASTQAERQKNGDPRPSLEERYRTGDAFVAAVTDASRKLVSARFLLQEDADRYVQAAKARAGTMGATNAVSQNTGHAQTAKAPFTDNYADVNGVRLHYVSTGQGPLVLFLHGYPSFWYQWKDQMLEMGRDHLAVGVDLRGYNLSSRPENVDAYKMPTLIEDVRQLAEKLAGKGRKFVLVGHDWGANIAWVFAMYHPDMLEKLIIINGAHPFISERELRENPAQRYASNYFFVFNKYLAAGEQPVDEKDTRESATRRANTGFVDAEVKAGRYTEEDRQMWIAAWSQPGSTTAGLNYYRANNRNPPFNDRHPASTIPRSWSAAEVTKGAKSTTIKVPTFVIWGLRDTAILSGHLSGLEKWVPDLRVKLYPEDTHWVMMEKPKPVAQDIRQFVTDEKSVPRESVYRPATK